MYYYQHGCKYLPTWYLMQYLGFRQPDSQDRAAPGLWMVFSLAQSRHRIALINPYVF